MTEEQAELSPKHLAFIDEYLRLFNATQAYLRIYPDSSYEAARRSASDLLTNPDIKAEITARLQEAHMSADEALKLTAEIARSDIGQILYADGESFGVDMQKAKESGLTKLIKKARRKTTVVRGKEGDEREITETEIEMYDAQAAQRDVLRVHGKFKDTVDLTSGGKIIKVTLTDD